MLGAMSFPRFCPERWVGVLLGLALSLAALPAAASIVEAFDLATLVTRSDHAVLATAVRTQSRWDGRGRIVTDVTLRVEDSMKGDSSAGDEVVLVVLGGEIGDIGMTVAGEPRFTPGDRAIVFAARSSQGRLRPVGMTQGVLPIVERGGRALVQPGGDGLSLVRRSRDGVLRPAPAALLEPRALDRVIDEIRVLALPAVRP